MATSLRLRRGTTAQHATFTGAAGEVTVDTDKNTVVVHDGSTAGGFPLLNSVPDPLIVAAGTNTAPSITTTGDTNTGIYFPAADTIAFTEGGVEAMRIDSSGNVGIGTSSPAVRLDVRTAAGTAAIQNIYTGSNAAAATLQFGQTGAIAWDVGITATSGNFQIGVNSGGLGYSISRSGTAIDYHAWSTSGFERMRIDSSGNVGIGTSNPAAKLDINGGLNFTGTGNRITGDFSNTTTANRVAFQTSTTNGATRLMVIPNGTADVAAINCVNSSDPTNASFAAFQVQQSSDVRIQSTIAGTGSYLPMTFYTGGSERMRIDSSGNVGIGVSSPAAKLDIFTATNTNFLVGFGANLDNYYTAGVSGIHVFRNALTERMRITEAGNVGIGTSTPSGNFQISGGNPRTRLTNTATTTTTVLQGADSGSGFIGTETNDLYYFITNNTERMRITSGGEVYIAGTTDRGAYNLQCNGTGVWGAGAYVNGSDARIKEDVAPIDSGLDVVEKLNPVTYRYKEDWSKDQSIQPGFIAQELLTALEGKNYVDGVVTQGGSEGYYSVAYQNLIPVLTKAIQELSAKVHSLQAEVNQLKGN